MVIALGMLVSQLLWGQINSGLTFSVSGEWDEDDTCLNSLLEWRLSGESKRNSSIAFRWEGEPFSSEERADEKALQHLGCTLRTPCLRAGSLCLEGCYDLIESEKFPVTTVLKRRGDFSLDREGYLYRKGGIALNGPEENLMIHYLYRSDYKQTGILMQTSSGRVLSGKGAFAYSWDGQGSGEDESWYGGSDGNSEEAYCHILTQIRVDGTAADRDWIVSATGSGCLAHNMLPGYAGYLYLEGNGPGGFLALSFQANGGHWRSCRGEPAEWIGGLGWKGEAFSGRFLVLTGSGCFYSPGVFEVSPGFTPKEIFPVKEGSLSLKAPFFSFSWSGEADSCEETSEQSIEGILFLERDDFRGNISYGIDWDDSWEQEWEGGFRWTGKPFRLEGGCGWSWEELFLQGQPCWRGKILWSSFPFGILSLAIEGGEEGILGELKLKRGKN